MNMFHQTLLILAKAQQSKARTISRLRIHLDMMKGASLMLEAHTVALEKGTNGSCRFLENIMTFCTVGLEQVMPHIKVGQMGAVCLGWTRTRPM
jgi:bifunctional pyridoxal-dependent enzyme with beta-cystathionase and maltose regulon repressor activities